MTGEPAKVVELVIYPAWQLVTMTLGDAQVTVLRLTHPRYGVLDFAIPPNEVAGISEALNRAKEGKPLTVQ